MISLLYPLLIAYTNAVTGSESWPPPAAALPDAPLEFRRYHLDGPPGTPTAARARGALSPFRARYRARFKGKPIGEGGFELETAAGVYQARFWMTATRGMAGAIGARFAEQGRFALAGPTLLPLDISHDSKGFLSRDRWQAQFDAARAALAGEYDGKAFRFEQAAGVLEPLTQIIDSAGKATAGLTAWTGTALVKNELRKYIFTAGAPQTLITPCAMFSAQRIHRSREASKAAQDIWQSAYIYPVPLRIDMIQRDGDVLSLELVRLERGGEIVCDAGRRLLYNPN